MTNAGEAGIRARVETLFAELDRLTPDEMARIGLERSDPVEHAELLRVVAVAARRSGRSALVAETRASARETMIRRFSSGGLQPTWVALNWGVSQGTADSRAALIGAVEDAVAAAVVADVADPEVVAALSLPASRLTSLSGARASGGSYATVVEPPAGPEYRDSNARWVAVLLAGLILGAWAGQAAGLVLGLEGGLIVLFATMGSVVLLARRSSRRRPAPLADEGGTGPS